MACAYNPRTLEAEAVGLPKVQGHLDLYSKNRLPGIQEQDPVSKFKKRKKERERKTANKETMTHIIV